jgi:hypothetical protein
MLELERWLGLECARLEQVMGVSINRVYDLVWKYMALKDSYLNRINIIITCTSIRI